MSDGTYRGRWVDEVFRTPHVSAEVKVFLLSLAHYDMTPTGRVSESRDRLADRFRCHSRKITAKFKAAMDAGLMEQTARGQKHQTAVYQAVIPGLPQGASNRHPETSPQGADNGRSEGAQGASNRHPDDSQGAGFYHPEDSAQGAGFYHPESAKSPQGADGGHPDSGSGCQQPAPHIYTGDEVADHDDVADVIALFDEENYSKTSLRSEKKPARKRASKSADEDPLFAEFYAVYPKKKDPGAARKAWAKAVAKVSDPRAIIDAAKLYADEKHGTNPTFIKHPSTWLNAESWRNEPDPPAPDQVAANGYQPYQNPADQSVYDEDM